MKNPPFNGTDIFVETQVHHYDRLPVQTQMYDILTYAHRHHNPSTLMLLEVVRLRFVRPQL